MLQWYKLAEMAKKYLKKGSRLYVEGKLKTRKYHDKAGQQKFVCEVIVESILML
jgi:single-strand DNA-binding protein